MNLLKIAPLRHKPLHKMPVRLCAPYKAGFHACGALLCLLPSVLLVLTSTADARESKSARIKPSTSANAQDALDKARPSYIYRAKRTDTPESIAFEFLDAAHSSAMKQRFYAHNNISQKTTRTVVAESTPFNIPVSWMYLKPSRASVLAVSGAVTMALPATQSTVVPKTALAEGARIQTGDNGFASIALPDGTVLSVEPNSDITLETLKQYASSDIFKINIVLNKGRIESDVKPLTSSESTYTIKSKRLTTGVRGTRFAVSDTADGTGNGLLEVLEGAVAVGSPSHGALNTPKGFGRVVEIAEPSELIDLFAQPTWRCDRDGAFSLGTDVSIATPDKTVQLKLDVYSGKHSDVKALTALAPLKQFSVKHTSSMLDLALPSGEYTVRARAIDAYGLQGNSASQAIAVTRTPIQGHAALPTAEDGRADWVRNHTTHSWVWTEYPAQLLKSDQIMTLLDQDNAARVTRTRCSAN